MEQFVKRFMSCEAGATAIEYAIIAAFVFIAIIVGGTAVGQEVRRVFSMVTATLVPVTP